jgi:hypothetical protein
MVLFKFERLPHFCFHCGMIKHGKMECMKRKGFRAQEAAMEFRLWLRVQSPSKWKDYERESRGEHGGHQNHPNSKEAWGWNGKTSHADSFGGGYREENGDSCN